MPPVSDVFTWVRIATMFGVTKPVNKEDIRTTRLAMHQSRGCVGARKLSLMTSLLGFPSAYDDFRAACADCEVCRDTQPRRIHHAVNPNAAATTPPAATPLGAAATPAAAAPPTTTPPAATPPLAAASLGSATAAGPPAAATPSGAAVTPSVAAATPSVPATSRAAGPTAAEPSDGDAGAYDVSVSAITFPGPLYPPTIVMDIVFMLDTEGRATIPVLSTRLYPEATSQSIVLKTKQASHVFAMLRPFLPFLRHAEYLLIDGGGEFAEVRQWAEELKMHVVTAMPGK